MSSHQVHQPQALRPATPTGAHLVRPSSKPNSRPGTPSRRAGTPSRVVVNMADEFMKRQYCPLVPVDECASKRWSPELTATTRSDPSSEQILPTISTSPIQGNKIEHRISSGLATPNLWVSRVKCAIVHPPKESPD
ncbi:hypothetical protein MVLG_04606 [Microbotryum lychnidis-dioicae p1A1 Lamole]|uniref:Uncharacterized protein n=1 Tax=Microbotryum lychnidis-dioicae (strain p1A1 Lamole / MvSl-1064) TaxID=683840 RepID=U5HBQ9_USTV1|nr:hypothetical protein MVLG_04606 [Microbotryum lychnidis-dioicae p1A1 Lamole]|eukprot:KDE04955.1 hypothetical protein MVLG_04606 [Microbotryum lychnidis-dioicae p1A1 Lamole]